MKNVALYGGTFSPPHLGHASAIEAVLRSVKCDEIWVMPSADRHDKKASADGAHRIKMLELMISELFPESEIPIILSDFELKLDKPTVTYETLRLLKEKYPDREFHFVLGSENLERIESQWVSGDKLFQEANFIAIKNPLLPMPEKLPPHITILENVVWTNISSTLVRKLIAQGRDGIPYITRKVSEYIKAHNLYE